MTVRYSIETQHCAPSLVTRYFDGFRILKGIGYWSGKAETCISIAILCDDTDDNLQKVLTLARAIREQYQQQEVWVTSELVTLRRITINANHLDVITFNPEMESAS